MRALPWILVGLLSIALTIAVCWIVFRNPEPTPEQVAAFLAKQGLLKAPAVDAEQQEQLAVMARIKARNIQKAAENFYLDQGQFPPALDALLERTEQGNGPYLQRKEDLLDPWGQPYQYDPSGVRNTQAGAKAVIPDVWTVAPSGNEIGNWVNK